MQARELLLTQFKQAHSFLESTISDVTDEAVSLKIEGATISPIGPIYAHVVLAEDAIVNEIIRGTKTVLESKGWNEKLDVQKAPLFQQEGWEKTRIDLPAFREYAAEVHAATIQFLESATDEELTKEVGQRNVPAIQFLGLVGLLHVAEHWGEIAALKGATGSKGLPF
ncbi:MAG: DinB family protein [Acidimicrobiia bacterium]